MNRWALEGVGRAVGRVGFFGGMMAGCFVAGSGFGQAVEGDAGAALYIQSCAGCHAIGGDAHHSGPNLAPMIMWEEEELEEAVIRMEKYTSPMSQEEVDSLVELLLDPEAAERLAAEKAGNGVRRVVAADGGGDEEKDVAGDWMIGTSETLSGDVEVTASPLPVDGGDDDLGAKFFVQSCAACHGIGSGAQLSGPDLAPTVQWPTEDLESAVIRMEKFAGPMSSDQVQALVELLQDPAADDRLKSEQEKKTRVQAASLEKPSAEAGERLYHGELAFANGGLACSACHAVGGRGGNMGPLLTDAYERLGAAALQSASEQANFPVMRAAYRDHKVTAQEALHLVEYLKMAGEDEAEGRSAVVPIFGTTGAVALLAGMGFLYRKRNGGPVHRKIARRR